MYFLRCGGTIVFAVVLSACSGSTTTDGGDAYGDGMDATDGADAGVDALDSLDASETDDVSEGGTVAFVGMIHVMQLTAGCMPVVPPDPLSFAGQLAIQNTGTATVGPVSASQGSIVMGMTEVASFSIAPVNIPAVAPGTIGMANTHNVSGTLMGGNVCATPPCGATVRVRVPISGPNVPAGAFVYSELVPMNCVF